MTDHQRAYAQLFALTQTLHRYDGVIADLRDNELHLTCWTGGVQRRETITCSPRPDDGGRLWFWDSQRRPLGEADKVTDVALVVARNIAVPATRDPMVEVTARPNR